MISTQEFHKQFLERHDFEYEDKQFLNNQYQGILFKDIPQAWVCCIDQYLSKMDSLGKLVSISQIFGFPVIQFENDISTKGFAILKDLEYSLLKIDDDLHRQLDIITIN